MSSLPHTDRVCDYRTDRRNDTGPAESEDCPSVDLESPIVTPDSLASALIVAACIVAAVVLAVWCWVTA